MMRVRNPNEAIRHREHDPLDHGGHHGDDSHGGGHGDDHNGHDDHGGESHSSSYIDRTKRFMDQGYSMSLKVLSGVHA